MGYLPVAYLCSMALENGHILPIADLGVSISGNNAPMPLKAKADVFGSMPKLVKINSVSNTPNEIWVTEIIPVFTLSWLSGLCLVEGLFVN